MSKLLNHSSTGRRSAFTLIEIMVATVIMIILVGLVIQITSEVLKVWNRSSGKLSANAEARIAMDLLTQDLETAVFRNNGQQWLRVESASDVGSPIAGETVALKLFAPALDRSEDTGDICAIAYKLAYGKAYDGTNAPKTYALYRAIEEPSTTFDDLMGSESDDDSPQLALTSDFWADSNIIDPDNFLAGNVVDFKIYVYGTDDDGNEELLNAASVGGDITSNYIFGGTGDSEEDILYADIILTIVSDEGLELLELDSTDLSSTGSAVEDVVRLHGEVFTRRVNFMAQPL
jgi:type II secretory pathway pseudopilin PulG